MDNLHMNTTLGTKWFTFYTKVRPWLVCVTSLTVISEFIQYTELYTSYWWMMLYFATSITQTVLGIIVFVKSRGDYIEFVSFAKKVLLFEIISLAYDQGVKQYIQSGFALDIAFAVAAIVFSISYFLWYRLNTKYFNKRIISTNYTTSTYDELFITEPVTEHAKVLYCRKCGNKLLDGSKFCNKCGNRIIEENNVQ